MDCVVKGNQNQIGLIISRNIKQIKPYQSCMILIFNYWTISHMTFIWERENSSFSEENKAYRISMSTI
jgi:hypothetical protein